MNIAVFTGRGLCREVAEAVTAARALAQQGDRVFLCAANLSAAEQPLAAHCGVDAVVWTQAAEEARTLAHFLAEASRAYAFELVLFPASRLHRMVAVAAAHQRGGDCTLDCTGITRENQKLYVTRPVYAGNVTARFCVTAPLCTVVLRQRCCAPFPPREMAAEMLFWPSPPQVDSRITQKQITPFPKNLLEEAGVVVIGGGGIESREDLELVQSFAAAIHAEFGATRPLVMSGRVPLSRLIGQSGKLIAPRLCITVAVSGATPFLAGIDGAQCLIAINRDPNAKVFFRADYGIIADYREALTKLHKHLEAWK